VGLLSLLAAILVAAMSAMPATAAMAATKVDQAVALLSTRRAEAQDNLLESLLTSMIDFM
jgi:hypothetical protein